MRHLRRPKKNRGSDWKTFLLVASLVALPAIIPTVLILRTSRPDVYWVRLPEQHGDAKFIEWKILDDLTETRDNPQTARPDLFGTHVKVMGYMLPFPFPDTANRDGRVGRFLLVPDPGNVLHPPHFHSGEVIDVRLTGGETVPFVEGKVVIARGVMSVDPMKLDRGEAVYHLLAASIQLYAE